MKCLRISSTDYEMYKEIGRQVNQYLLSSSLEDRPYKFTSGRGPGRTFPLVKELQEWGASKPENFKEWFPCLLYYREPELFNSDDPEFAKTRQYLTDLFLTQLRVIDIEYYEYLNTLRPKEWFAMTFEDKCKFLSEYAGEFDDDEASEFADDIMTKRFMKGKRKSETSERKKDLMNIFHTIKNSKDMY